MLAGGNVHRAPLVRKKMDDGKVPEVREEKLEVQKQISYRGNREGTEKSDRAGNREIPSDNDSGAAGGLAAERMACDL